MTSMSLSNGREWLPNGFDVGFRHSITVRLFDNDQRLTVPEPTLIEEITALGALHVELGR